MTGSLLALTLLVGAQPHEPWTPATQEHIAMVAAKLMPAAMAGQLTRYSEELRAGARYPFQDEDSENHALHADGRFGHADRMVQQQVTKVVTLLNERVPMRQVVFELGVTAHYVADVASPLATSDLDAREPSYSAALAGYAESRLARFPPVFDGYYPFNEKAFIPADYLRSTAERANRFYPLVGQAFYPDPDGPVQSTRSFDDRSPVFGITQLSFNHAVSAVANVWLHIWREAHGDMSGAARARALGEGR